MAEQPNKKSDPKNEQRNAADKELKKALQKQKNRFQQLEERIALLNKKKISLESDLASKEVYGDKSKFLETETSYKKAMEELDAANREYELVFEQLMELEEKMQQAG